jgi:hypothetical protein
MSKTIKILLTGMPDNVDPQDLREDLQRGIDHTLASAGVYQANYDVFIYEEREL